MNMMAGAVIINLSPKNHRLFRILEPLTPPIYALFFVLAGLELQPAVIFKGEVLLLGSVYIIARAVGKYGGVFAGGLATKTEGRIRNYLGFCMLPQAGVAIGLILLIQVSPVVAALPGNARLIIDNMVNIVLLSVFINELIGPPLSKFAILRGNENGGIMDFKNIIDEKLPDNLARRFRQGGSPAQARRAGLQERYAGRCSG